MITDGRHPFKNTRRIPTDYSHSFKCHSLLLFHMGVVLYNEKKKGCFLQLHLFTGLMTISVLLVFKMNTFSLSPLTLRLTKPTAYLISRPQI